MNLGCSVHLGVLVLFEKLDFCQTNMFTCNLIFLYHVNVIQT